MKTQVRNPLISVVIPCFNCAHFLPETLQSVLDQTYTNWECLIINDGSEDDTEKVAQNYVKRDRRFKCFSQSNQGVSVARNTGIKNCRGKYIQLLDADDFIAPEKFKNQLKCFKANPSIDIVYSEYQCFDNDDRNKTWVYSRVQLRQNPIEDFAQNWEKGLSIPIHCFLYKKSCFDKWGGFDESLYKEDWDVHLRFSAAGAKYVFSNGVYAFYRFSRFSRARDSLKMEQGNKILFKKYIFTPNISLGVRFIFLRRYLERSALNLIYIKMINLMKKIR